MSKEASPLLRAHRKKKKDIIRTPKALTKLQLEKVMLTFPTQLPFFDVSKDLCEFVAINELSSSLNTTSHFHNRYNTSSWHIFPHQVHQIKAKAWQFSPSHTCYSSQVLEARFAFHFEPHKPITTKQWCHVRENCHVMHSARSTRPLRKQIWPDNSEILRLFADTSIAREGKWLHVEQYKL